MPNAHYPGPVPAFFYDDDFEVNGPPLPPRTESKRMSILRDPQLGEAVKAFANVHDKPNSITQADLRPFYTYMEGLSGRALGDIDRGIFHVTSRRICLSFHYIVCPKNQTWKRFPEEPECGLEVNPEPVPTGGLNGLD
ncbi:unnamed protein product [Somion occarium]|uniref:Uncharacterized protein n=1 Tax=Somion occarium TaxID=3059160 RepID=A0ABP1DJN4_9APHY